MTQIDPSSPSQHPEPDDDEAGVAVDALGSSYTASSGADIDADGTPQSWGYTKGPNGPVASENLNNGGTCDETMLTPEVVGPCDPTHGQSVF